MASALAAAGATVALTGRSSARATAVAGELPRAAGIELDVRDESSVARAVDEARSRLGGIDMLVNNAGIGMRTVNPRFMTHPQGFWEVPVSGLRAVIETNMTGYFLVAREVTPRMLAAGGGRIVNISVNHSTMPRAGFVPYGPSRAGSGALSRIMAPTWGTQASRSTSSCLAARPSPACCRSTSRPKVRDSWSPPYWVRRSCGWLRKRTVNDAAAGLSSSGRPFVDLLERSP
jgi:NAD(P)-dependent dehydrogenase (short-subunit alcohol dehydrogenase family)